MRGGEGLPPNLFFFDFFFDFFPSQAPRTMSGWYASYWNVFLLFGTFDTPYMFLMPFLSYKSVRMTDVCDS